MNEHTNELQERFADAAITLMMDQYAQEDGNALLQRYQEDAHTTMPEQLDLRCKRVIQNTHKSTLMGSTLKRAARAAACALVILILSFPFAMSVEAIRIPVINFMLKHGKGFTEITFSQDSDGLTAADHLREIIRTSIPDGYQLAREYVETASSKGTETVFSVIIRYEDDRDTDLEIMVMKAKGSFNIDSQNATVTSMELYGQPAVFVAGEELRVMWINENHGQIYSVIGYGTDSETFWECVHALSEATQNTKADISF